MNHLDEGTIHAWLDGALDAAQSREIEAHVAACAKCSDSVAEARGLIAASSRILTALDDVPGGVVPKRTAPQFKPARRQWRAAPWVSAIAATLVIAVVVSQSMREGDQQVAGLKAPVADSTVTRAAEELPRVATTPSAQPVSPPVARSLRDTGRILLRGPSPLTGNARADSPRRLADGRANDRAAPVGGRAAGAGASAERARSEVVAAAPVPAAAAEPKEALESRKLALDQVVVTGIGERAKRPGDEREPDRFAGCYRIEPARQSAVAAAAQKAAGVVGRVAQARSAAPSAAASAYVAPAPPAIVRLDPTRHPLGYVARDARSDSSVGTWLRVGPDSASVDMLAAGLFKVALKNRVTCPER